MEPCTALYASAVLNCVLGSVGAVTVDHVLVPTTLPIKLSATLRTGDVLLGHLLSWLDACGVVMVASGSLLEGLAAVGAYEVGCWCLDTPTPGLPAGLGVTVTTGFVPKCMAAFWACELVSVRRTR